MRRKEDVRDIYRLEEIYHLSYMPLLESERRRRYGPNKKTENLDLG